MTQEISPYEQERRQKLAKLRDAAPILLYHRVSPTNDRAYPALAPADEEVVVVKRRVSAFTGSDLEVILRAYGIQHLVLAGLSTSGVVLSTLREAADKDYRVTVLSDCCADRDEEVHRVLTTKVFLMQADVVGVEERGKQ